MLSRALHTATAFCAPVAVELRAHRSACGSALRAPAPAAARQSTRRATRATPVCIAAGGSGAAAGAGKVEIVMEDAAATTAPRKWRLYVIEGSQFAAKAMLALDTQDMKYDCVHVSAVSRDKREKELPTGGYKVPEVEIPVGGTADKFTAMAESSAILRAIDDYPHGGPGKLYPSEDVDKADEHISSVIDSYVVYFNHVSEAGWTRSIRAAITDKVPLGGLVGAVLPLHALYSSPRNKFRKQAMEGLGVGEEAMNDKDMTAGLIRELERYDAALSRGDYLYGFSYPTAADCALHAMLSRFVDGMGDSGLPGSLPSLWDEAGPKLDRLKAWQARMRSKYPMRWSRYKVSS